MTERDPLTPEMKWQVTSRLVTSLPVMYDITFRDAVGDRYDDLEQHIWVHLAREAKALADSANLPTRDARDLMDTLRVIFGVFFGPDLRTEEVPINPERAVLMVKRCPFLFREMEMRTGSDHLLSRCLSFSIATVEALNPGYTLRFVRSMCTGDRTCELKIMKREDAEKDDAR